MPGVFQFALSEIAAEAQRASDLGLQAVLLFGIPKEKDEQATSAYAGTASCSRPFARSSPMPRAGVITMFVCANT